MFKIATVRDESGLELPFLLLFDIIIPEAILVVIVVDRYKVLIGDVVCGFDVVEACVGLQRKVSQASL